MTIDLKPEFAERLCQDAAREGIPPEEYAARALEEAAGLHPPHEVGHGRLSGAKGWETFWTHFWKATRMSSAKPSRFFAKV
jgi:hypothetical protein